MSEQEIDSTAGAEPDAANPSAVSGAVTDQSDESVAEPVAPGEDSPADAGPVAGALAGLDTLADRDLAEHPEVFERIHGELHAALTAIDDA